MPNPIIGLVTVAMGLLLFALMNSAALMSIREEERRAAARLFGLSLLATAPYLLVGFSRFAYRDVIAGGMLLLPVLVAVVMLLPTQRFPREDDTPRTRIDERDIMFARRRLEPGSKRFAEYYRQHPDKMALDDRFRAKPGLMSPQAAYGDPVLFAAAEASFSTVAAFHTLLDREPGDSQVAVNPADLSTFVKRWGKKLGAVSVGITDLRDYHLYSHLGRNEPYGQPIEREHAFAIALTVEMDKAMIDRAPYGPTLMESAQQYLNAGAIASQLAEFLHNLGYAARAHIDGNYRVVCPLVARDAGLGEIGRMGLLMTPELGPRVRLAVVTTNAPLVINRREVEDSVIDFCRQCQKCAEACPSRAISFDDRTEIDGVRRWQINSEACFTFWCTVGTDCARCIQVCPYAHPDNWLHNLVRAGIRRSSLFRTAAVCWTISSTDASHPRAPSRSGWTSRRSK